MELKWKSWVDCRDISKAISTIKYEKFCQRINQQRKDIETDVGQTLPYGRRLRQGPSPKGNTYYCKVHQVISNCLPHLPGLLYGKIMLCFGPLFIVFFIIDLAICGRSFFASRGTYLPTTTSIMNTCLTNILVLSVVKYQRSFYPSCCKYRGKLW